MGPTNIQDHDLDLYHGMWLTLIQMTAYDWPGSRWRIWLTWIQIIACDWPGSKSWHVTDSDQDHSCELIWIQIMACDWPGSRSWHVTWFGFRSRYMIWAGSRWRLVTDPHPDDGMWLTWIQMTACDWPGSTVSISPLSSRNVISSSLKYVPGGQFYFSKLKQARCSR